MSKILIIGAGGVGRVVAYKCAQNSEVFSNIILVARRKSQCEKIVADINNDLGVLIAHDLVDANDKKQLVKLFNKWKPTMVIHVALPYQDLTIMDACLTCGVHYLDTANYEPLNEAKFEYKWQWEYDSRFKDAGLMAILGCGFDPGVTGVFVAHAAKNVFDEIQTLDIVDCNAGNHGKPFATNFNPEINIREITQNGKYWKNRKWIETKPLAMHKMITYPNIGQKKSFLTYHEELESIIKNFPTISQARFWMTFDQEYLSYLHVLQNIGMTSIEPINYQGNSIVPLQFLKAVLPDPSELGANYIGETSIGCRIKGLKNGKEKFYSIWNNCQHQTAYKETRSQAVSYTTGTPAMLGAYLVLTKAWKGTGVFNVEELDPDPFLEKLSTCGLPWNQKEDRQLQIP